MKMVAIANQKGDVGKTSTANSLEAGLVRTGTEVLLINLDPQASLTEYLLDSLHLGEKIHLLPVKVDLSAAEVPIPAITNCEKRLACFLKRYSADCYLIDCPANLGMLTRNVLTAANTVLICHNRKDGRTNGQTHHGLYRGRQRKGLNSSLTNWRILSTMYTRRENEDNLTLEELYGKYGKLVYIKTSSTAH